MHELDVSIRRLAVGVLPAKPAQVGDAQPDHQLARRGSDYPGFAAFDSCCEIPFPPVNAPRWRCGSCMALLKCSTAKPILISAKAVSGQCTIWLK